MHASSSLFNVVVDSTVTRGASRLRGRRRSGTGCFRCEYSSFYSQLFAPPLMFCTITTFCLLIRKGLTSKHANVDRGVDRMLSHTVAFSWSLSIHSSNCFSFQCHHCSFDYSNHLVYVHYSAGDSNFTLSIAYLMLSFYNVN